MPLLNENAPVFAGWPVDQSFVSELPDRDTLIAAATSEFFEVTQADFVKGGFENFANAVMKAIYEISKTWGVEEFRIPGLEDFSIDLSRLSGLPPAQLAAELASQVIHQTLDAVFAAVGAVPIAGWMIDIIWGVVDTIWIFVTMYRETNKEPPGRAIEYSKSTDEDITNRVLDFSSSNNWTDVFLPMRAPDGFKSDTVIYETSNVEAYHVLPYGGQDFNGLAVMPGFPKVFADFQIGKYSRPRARPLSGDPDPRDVGQGPAMNMGSLVPSTQQLGFSMWSMVRKNSPNAFKIDPDKINLAWNDWFYALIDYIKWLAKEQDPPDHKAQRLNWLARFTTMGWYEDGNLSMWPESGLKDNEAFANFFFDRFGSTGYMFPAFQYWFEGEFDIDPEKRQNAPNSKIPGAYFVSWLPAIKFFMHDYGRAVLDQFTKTLTIAYVGPDFPALKNPAIKRNWEEYRKLLLSHSARNQVELDLIPDQEYRNAMAQAQSQPIWDLTAAPSGPGSFDIVPAPYIPPEFPVPPSGPGVPGTPRRRRRFARSEAAMLAIMAGSAAAWKGPELLRMASRAVQRRRR